MSGRVMRLFDESVSDRRLWLLTLVPVAAVYLIAAHWAVTNFDAEAASWPGWALVHHHTLHLESIPDFPRNPWFIRSHGHVVSSRMPGVVLIGVPLEALAWTSGLVMVASTATAALVTAAAVANVAVLLRSLSSVRYAVAGAALLAFGTSLWTTAGGELWTHGPDALWLSAGMLALHRKRHLLAGAFLALGVLTRPHLAVVVLAIGLTLAWRHRQARPLFSLGLPAVAALGGVVLYNLYLFGHASIAGGTYSYAATSALDGVSGGSSLLSTLHPWAVNTAGLLTSPMRGLLAYSPVIVLALLALRPAWRELPDWGKGATIGGLAYLLLQAKINRFLGGYDYYGSRLTIESLVLWTPLLFLALRHLWRTGHRAAIVIAGWLSVSINVVGAVMGHTVNVVWSVSPWTTWLPWSVVSAHGWSAAPIVALLVLALPVTLAQSRRRREASPAVGLPALVPAA